MSALVASTMSPTRTSTSRTPMPLSCWTSATSTLTAQLVPSTHLLSTSPTSGSRTSTVPRLVRTEKSLLILLARLTPSARVSLFPILISLAHPVVPLWLLVMELMVILVWSVSQAPLDYCVCAVVQIHNQNFKVPILHVLLPKSRALAR
jgi:hypothetical protein